MRRSINDQLGYADRFNKNENIMSYNQYPAQGEAVGKYIAINFLDYSNQLFNYRVRFQKSTTYEQFEDIIPGTYDPDENLPIIFKIVRYDVEAPYKAILVSTYGHLIVTTTEELDKVSYYDEYYCRDIQRQITDMNKQMYVPVVITESEEEFIESFASERITIYPIQSNILYGRRVWIEYDNDLMNIPYGEEYQSVDPNKYEFTDQMAEEVIERDNTLRVLPKEQLASYPVYYNIHSKSFVDNPKRSMGTGWVVRADIDSPDGQVVVIQTDGTNAKFICLDEARFYYDTEDTRKIDINIPIFYGFDDHNLYNYIESLI